MEMPTKLLGDAFESLQRARTTEDLRTETEKFARQLGFENFIYALIITAPTLRPQRFVINGYPQDWMDHYEKQGYFNLDPLVRHAYCSTLPSIWDSGAFQEGKAQRFWEDAQAFGLRAGLSFSVHEQPGVIGIFSVSRDRVVDLQGQDLAALVGRAHLFSSLLHHAVYRLDIPSVLPAAGAALTPREVECLKWSAEGKTAWEIGQILSIAERTVVFHINNVVQKLGASNKIQAIVRAVVLKLV